MSGHLVLDDGQRFNLSSGKTLEGGCRNCLPDHVAPPGTTPENFHHLENQSSAIMRRNPGVNATLYLTGTYGACKYCRPAMRAMLPEGGRLLVIWRNEAGVIKNRMFIGGAD
ncbi:DddA-like double-stranded DNA deaminase toxin [Streptomyces sp. NPDC001381]|uniref:DddA-like double-stranded DNA deaminase toxin n=1 Tax=Streptomyces sp. NPDC001381 TaxID=3364567 RepID=UPI0036A0570D